MKKLLVVVALLFSITAFADDGTGYTIGFDTGWASIKYQPNSYAAYLTNTSAVASSVNKRRGFAWDVHIGYKLYRELGWEAGYMKFSNAKFSYNTAPTRMTVRRHDFDFLIRGDFPISSTVNSFMKFGMANVHTRFEAASGDISNIIAWTPAYGWGLSYAINSHTGVNAQWLHINRVKPSARTAGFTTDDVPATNYFSVGMLYRF